MMHRKGFGRKWLWPIPGTVPELSRGTREKLRKIAIRIACVSVEIRTEHLPITILGRYRWTQTVRPESGMNLQ
jgi:hypothetical protein